MRRKGLVVFCCLMVLLFTVVNPAFGRSCVILTDQNPGKPVLHGLTKVEQALAEKGINVLRTTDAGAVNDCEIILFVGLAQGDGVAANMIAEQKLERPSSAEALLIHKMNWQGESARRSSPLISGEK